MIEFWKGARIRDIGTGCHVRLHVRSRNVHQPKKIGQIIGFSTQELRALVFFVYFKPILWLTGQWRSFIMDHKYKKWLWKAEIEFSLSHPSVQSHKNHELSFSPGKSFLSKIHLTLNKKNVEIIHWNISRSNRGHLPFDDPFGKQGKFWKNGNRFRHSSYVRIRTLKCDFSG